MTSDGVRTRFCVFLQISKFIVFNYKWCVFSKDTFNEYSWPFSSLHLSKWYDSDALPNRERTSSLSDSDVDVVWSEYSYFAGNGHIQNTEKEDMVCYVNKSDKRTHITNIRGTASQM